MARPSFAGLARRAWPAWLAWPGQPDAVWPSSARPGLGWPGVACAAGAAGLARLVALGWPANPNGKLFDLQAFNQHSILNIFRLWKVNKKYACIYPAGPWLAQLAAGLAKPASQPGQPSPAARAAWRQPGLAGPASSAGARSQPCQPGWPSPAQPASPGWPSLGTAGQAGPLANSP